MRVCIFGDSLTLGVGDPNGVGWVGRFAGHERARSLAVLGAPLLAWPAR
jgi:lysophospholipase L1-like esterase